VGIFRLTKAAARVGSLRGDKKPAQIAQLIRHAPDAVNCEYRGETPARKEYFCAAHDRLGTRARPRQLGAKSKSLDKFWLDNHINFLYFLFIQK
jgi:hypothetical protein